MGRHEEFVEMLYDQAVKLNDDIDSTKAGTDDRSNAVADLTAVAEKIISNRQTEIDEEDKRSKREEQERVNEEELTIKKAQLINETERLEMDRESRKSQIKNEFARIGIDGLATFARLMMWSRFTSVAMREEYNLNGSRALPIGIQRAIDRKAPGMK